MNNPTNNISVSEIEEVSYLNKSLSYSDQLVDEIKRPILKDQAVVDIKGVKLELGVYDTEPQFNKINYIDKFNSYLELLKLFSLDNTLIYHESNS